MIFEQSFWLATPPGVLFTFYDSVTRTPAYIPPEYTDVGTLTNDLVSWYATDHFHLPEAASNRPSVCMIKVLDEVACQSRFRRVRSDDRQRDGYSLDKGACAYW